MNADTPTSPVERPATEKKEVEQTLPDVGSIPRALVQCMGALAGLLLVVGSGVLLLRWWDDLHIGVQVGCLVLPLGLMWGGYAVAARRGMRSAEVLGAFASVSWLLVLLVWQTLSPTTPHWQPCGLFVLGALAVAVFFPNRTSVVMLGVASVAVMVLLWYQTTAGWSQPAGMLVWAGVVAVLCLWGLGGFLCGLSRNRVYAPYAFLGPLMYSVYLLVLQGILLYYPSIPGGGGYSKLWVAVLWLVPVAVFCLVHRMHAARQGKPGLSSGLIAMVGAMYLVLPVGLWVNAVFPLVPSVLLLLGYAVSMVYYGASYKSTYFMVAGCAFAFMTAVGVSFGQGGSMVGGGITMLLLGGAFGWFAWRLYSRRRLLQIGMLRLQKRRALNKK